MPFFTLRYAITKDASGVHGRLLCGKCGSEPGWHAGAADAPDLPIQLRCDTCFTQCAEFLTEQDRIRELQELHERAVTYNQDIIFSKPKFPL